ncbi:hypothetical protein [uncultured Flavobacterium sp.]|uniref:hypothetical protein n=1 Tax=uncultured Flavobacterium sp. TaxID=165435 RepID=UPI0030816E0B
MKHFFCVLICSLTLMFSTKVESKQLVNAIHSNQNSFGQKNVKKDLSELQNNVLASFNNADKLSSENLEKYGLDERFDDHFAFLSFDKTTEFYSNYKFPKSERSTEFSSCLYSRTTIPFYILFCSMLIPSFN